MQVEFAIADRGPPPKPALDGARWWYPPHQLAKAVGTIRIIFDNDVIMRKDIPILIACVEVTQFLRSTLSEKRIHCLALDFEPALFARSSETISFYRYHPIEYEGPIESSFLETMTIAALETSLAHTERLSEEIFRSFGSDVADYLMAVIRGEYQ